MFFATRGAYFEGAERDINEVGVAGGDGRKVGVVLQVSDKTVLMVRIHMGYDTSLCCIVCERHVDEVKFVASQG